MVLRRRILGGRKECHTLFDTRSILDGLCVIEKEREEDEIE
jgi:hypothetical protein